MTGPELVEDGFSVISDESDFYGSEQVRGMFEKRVGVEANRILKRKHERLLASSAAESKLEELDLTHENAPKPSSNKKAKLEKLEIPHKGSLKTSEKKKPKLEELDLTHEENSPKPSASKKPKLGKFGLTHKNSAKTSVSKKSEMGELDRTHESSFKPSTNKKQKLEELDLTHDNPQKPSAYKKPEPEKLDPTSNMSTQGISDFLKSRPQLAGLKNAQASQASKPHHEPVRNLSGKKVDDLVETNIDGSSINSWWQFETVDNFLRRLPVADPATASFGPWLWVHRQSQPRRWVDQRNKTDEAALIDVGKAKLAAYLEQTSKLEEQFPNAVSATITRKIGPYRDQLEEDLLSAAVDSGTTCGKWMLFPMPDNLERTWRLVAEATAEGKLGPTSKVGTFDPETAQKGTLICVYTYDFSDSDDVKRVLEELVELDVIQRDGKPIYYKYDAYTYLGIVSDNAYKLRASLYSSKEVLNDEVKAKKEGPVARLKKKNHAIDEFFNS